MRATLFATVPLALLLAVTPAQGQVSVGVHIDIPIIGRGTGGDYRRGPVREVRIYDNPPVPYGQWKKHYRDWHRVTLYVFDDRYYDYPVRGGRETYVYRDHDRYFWGPGDGNWDHWDRWDRGGRDDRDDRDDYRGRPMRGNDGNYDNRGKHGKQGKHGNRPEYQSGDDQGRSSYQQRGEDPRYEGRARRRN